MDINANMYLQIQMTHAGCIKMQSDYTPPIDAVHMSIAHALQPTLLVKC